MNFRVDIAAHPARADRVDRLVEQVTSEGAGVRVFWDPQPQGPPDVWRTVRQAWTAPTPHSHRLVLQDDAVPCRDFCPAVDRIASLYPDRAVNLFVIRQAHADSALTRGVHLVPLPDWLYSVAILLPAAMGPDYVAWAEEQRRDGVLKDDVRLDDDHALKLYLRHLRRPMWGTVPCLVQHGAPADSLLGHSRRSRTSDFFLGEDVSGLDVDWRVSA